MMLQDGCDFAPMARLVLVCLFAILTWRAPKLLLETGREVGEGVETCHVGDFIHNQYLWTGIILKTSTSYKELV